MSDLYHLGIPEDRVPARVLLVSPPLEQVSVAARLDDPEDEISRREYRSVRGTHRGRDVLVCSSGTGGPPLAIAVEELARAGASAFVLLQRLGRPPQHNLIVTGAIRDEGTTGHYAPPTFPAVPDAGLTTALRDQLGDHLHGVLRSVDVLHSPDVSDQGGATRAEVRGVDLQSAPLFVVGAALGVRTASVAIGELASLETVAAAALDALIAPMPNGHRMRA